MNDTSIILCPNCGQKLRIPTDRGTIHVTCPKCTKEWEWPPTDRFGSNGTAADASVPPRGEAKAGASHSPRSGGWFSSLRQKRPGVGTLVFLGFVVYIGFRLLGCVLTYTPPKPLSGPEANVPESRRAIWNAPIEQPLPKNGHGLFYFNRAAADSALLICPRREQGHIVVKVEDSTNERLLCWLFIRQGESVDTPIPAGSYRLKLAFGKKWYGERNLFGPGGAHSAIVNEIKVPTRAIYTIDLHSSPSGTLRETNLRAENF